MVLAAVVEVEEKSSLYLSFNKKTINSRVFQNNLHSKMVPRPSIVCREYNFVLVQDITTLNTSKLTVSWRTNRQYFGLGGFSTQAQT